MLPQSHSVNTHNQSQSYSVNVPLGNNLEGKFIFFFGTVA